MMIIYFVTYFQIGGTAYSPFGAAYTASTVPASSYWYGAYPQQLGAAGLQAMQGYSYGGQFAHYHHQYMG